MEYIEGQTLAAMVRERRPDERARGDGHRHRSVPCTRRRCTPPGLLHRDIKAQNVMREVGGRIVLMDFSGAQALVPAGQDVDCLGHAALHGARSSSSGVGRDGPSDVYSLGVLLFFLLHGPVPVEGRTMADLKTRARTQARESGCAICGRTCRRPSCR